MYEPLRCRSSGTGVVLYKKVGYLLFGNDNVRLGALDDGKELTLFPFGNFKFVQGLFKVS